MNLLELIWPFADLLGRGNKPNDVYNVLDKGTKPLQCLNYAN